MKKQVLFLLALIVFAQSSAFAQSQINTNALNLQVLNENAFGMILHGGLFPEIDFYNSHDLVLYRKLNGNEVGAVQGKLVITNKDRFEYIYLKRRTVGRVLTSPSYTDRVNVSFDARHPENTLEFRRGYNGNRYELVLKSNGNTYECNDDISPKDPTVEYAGHTFYVKVTGNNAFSTYIESKKNNTDCAYRYYTANLHLLYDNIYEGFKQTFKDTLKSFPSRRKH